jgi:hypothetical protein
MSTRLLSLLCTASLLSSPAASLPDADRILAQIDARHRPHGALLDPVFASPASDDITGYSRCGDSAIWTGHLLAAESFRYARSRSPADLARILRTLDVIRQLIDVTGNDLLARCAFPATSPWAPGILAEEAAHGAYTGIVDGQPWLWIGNTSRDQYLGVFFGLTAAWNLVDHPHVRGAVGWLAKRLLDPLTRHGWTLFMPDGRVSTTFLHRPDQQLALLKLGARAGSRSFRASYDSLALFSAPSLAAILAAEALEPHDSYFKFNLDYITFYCLLSAPDSGWLRTHYLRAFEVLRQATRSHQNAFFDVLAATLTGDGDDNAIAALLDDCLRRPQRDFPVDLRPLYPACGDNRACHVIPVSERVTTDFLWQRSPFQLYGGGSGRIESSQLDYLLPYSIQAWRRPNLF